MYENSLNTQVYIYIYISFFLFFIYIYDRSSWSFFQYLLKPFLNFCSKTMEFFNDLLFSANCILKYKTYHKNNKFWFDTAQFVGSGSELVICMFPYSFYEPRLRPVIGFSSFFSFRKFEKIYVCCRYWICALVSSSQTFSKTVF